MVTSVVRAPSRSGAICSLTPRLSYTRWRSVSACAASGFKITRNCRITISCRPSASLRSDTARSLSRGENSPSTCEGGSTMQELRGDLWDFYEDHQWIVITTNGAVRHDGACVMGRGIALQAAQRMPDLPFRVGDRIRQAGNRVFAFSTLHLFTFPVKRTWGERATLPLIVESAEQLMK